MKHALRLVVGCLLATLGLGLALTGDAANGFTITYADGERLFPPTGSEARAECSEYDTRVARVRCRVGVRTWYRDLGDLQRPLAHVREHGR